MTLLPEPKDSDPGDEQPVQVIAPAQIDEAFIRTHAPKLHALMELEALLPPEPKPQPAAKAVFSELDDLLNDSMAQQVLRDVEKEEAKRAKAAVEATRKRLARDPDALSPSEREALRAKILSWEAAHEWTPTTFLYVEEVDLCACGSTDSHFLGLYQIQQSKERAGERRLVLWAPQAMTPECEHLPRVRHQVARAVPFCPSCREGKGFALAYDGELWAQEATCARAQANAVNEEKPT